MIRINGLDKRLLIFRKLPIGRRWFSPGATNMMIFVTADPPCSKFSTQMKKVNHNVVMWEIDFWENLIVIVLAHDGCDDPGVGSLKHLQQAADHGMVHHALKINLWIRMFHFLRIIKMTFSTFSNSALVSFSSLFLTTIYEYFYSMLIGCIWQENNLQSF